MANKSKCDGWHSIDTEIQESSSIKDLESRVVAWPGDFFLGHGNTKKEAKNAAKDKAREAANKWCEKRTACDDGLKCQGDNFKFSIADPIYSESFEEWAVYLTITKIKCKCE